MSANSLWASFSNVGVDIALITTIVIQVLTSRKYHRDNLKKDAINHVDIWIRDPFIQNFDVAREKYSNNNFDIAASYISESWSQIQSNSQEYPVLGSTLSGLTQKVSSKLGIIHERLVSLDTGAASLPETGITGEDVAVQLFDSWVDVRNDFANLISCLKEEINLTDLVVLGVWGRYLPLRNAIPSGKESKSIKDMIILASASMFLLLGLADALFGYTLVKLSYLVVLLSGYCIFKNLKKQRRMME